MTYWLMKSEPEEFALETLARRGARGEPWNGVRNYQARNFMRAMRVGDLALFYASNCLPPGVDGVMRVIREAYPDPSAWDPASPYADSRGTPERPVWDQVDVAWVATFDRRVDLGALRADAALADMLILRRGNRLSVTPVAAAAFRRICVLGGVGALKLGDSGREGAR